MTTAIRTRLPLVDRKDLDVIYPDNGCTIAPSCLNCPLPRCRYDTTKADLEAAMRRRDAAVMNDYRTALARRIKHEAIIPAIAARHGVSKRTVHRAIERSR